MKDVATGHGRSGAYAVRRRRRGSWNGKQRVIMPKEIGDRRESVKKISL